LIKSRLWLGRHERFVTRSTGKRFVVDRKNIKRSVAESCAQCRLRYPARIVKIQDGQEKTYHLRYGVEPIRLLGRDEQMSHPLRNAADHLAALLRHSTLPVLCAG
jgi:hypothetical protein